jgi:hypothetical protein
MLLFITEWTGTIFGIAGAALLSSNIKHSPWGWWLFLISSLSLCLFAALSNAWGLLLLNAAFVSTNLNGIARVWLPHFRALKASLAASASAS